MQSEIPKEIPGYQQSEALGAAGITAETFLWVDRMAKEPKTKIKPTNIFQFIYYSSFVLQSSYPLSTILLAALGFYYVVEIENMCSEPYKIDCTINVSKRYLVFVQGKGVNLFLEPHFLFYYSRVHISWNEVFSKILKKPSIVQK